MAVEYIGESFSIKLMIAEAALVIPTYEDLTSIRLEDINTTSKVLISEGNKVYYFNKEATEGDYAPVNQVDGIGFWIIDPNNGRMSFDSFIKVEAHIVLESLNQSVLKFSNITQEGFKDMAFIDEYTRRLLVEDFESAKFEPGDYILEIHKYLADTRFVTGYKREKQKLRLWTFKDSVR